MHQKLIDEMSIADYRTIASGEMYDWSPKEIEEWIHTGGGIIGQDAAVKAAAMTVYNHYEGRPSVSLFIGPTGSGKTEIWRALQREYGAQHYYCRCIKPHRRRLERQQQAVRYFPGNGFRREKKTRDSRAR